MVIAPKLDADEPEMARDDVTRWLDGAIAALPQDARVAGIAEPRPEIDRAAYLDAVARVKAYIEAGDCYQVNLTFAIDVATSVGPPGTSATGVDELVRRANATDFGLAAAVWTRDVSRTHDVARRLRAGTVWVNCYDVFDAAAPFGGFKFSGIGRELGAAGLANYTELKTVTVNLG